MRLFELIQTLQDAHDLHGDLPVTSELQEIRAVEVLNKNGELWQPGQLATEVFLE